MPRFEYRGHESARQHKHNDYYNLWKKRQKKGKKKVCCSAISKKFKSEEIEKNKTE